MLRGVAYGAAYAALATGDTAVVAAIEKDAAGEKSVIPIAAVKTTD